MSRLVFYGLFGGFIVLQILGAVTGYLAGRSYETSSRKNKQLFGPVDHLPPFDNS